MRSVSLAALLALALAAPALADDQKDHHQKCADAVRAAIKDQKTKPKDHKALNKDAQTHCHKVLVDIEIVLTIQAKIDKHEGHEAHKADIDKIDAACKHLKEIAEAIKKEEAAAAAYEKHLEDKAWLEHFIHEVDVEIGHLDDLLDDLVSWGFDEVDALEKVCIDIEHELFCVGIDWIDLHLTELEKDIDAAIDFVADLDHYHPKHH